MPLQVHFYCIYQLLLNEILNSLLWAHKIHWYDTLVWIERLNLNQFGMRKAREQKKKKRLIPALSGWSIIGFSHGTRNCSLTKRKNPLFILTQFKLYSAAHVISSLMIFYNRNKQNNNSKRQHTQKTYDKCNNKKQ